MAHKMVNVISYILNTVHEVEMETYWNIFVLFAYPSMAAIYYHENVVTR